MNKILKSKVMSVVMCLIVMIGVIPIAVFAQGAVSREAQEHITSQLQRASIPNAAVAVIRSGETSYMLMDSRQDTLFEIGSVSKTFTAFGVLMLEEMGLLSVADPVNMHLPWFEARYNGTIVPHGDIRIYHFLQHTSGFTHDERRFPTIVIETASEFISAYAGIELAFYPSTGHSYSNAGYMLLGLLIEAVSGLSYDEFMTQYVLHPLGLYSTFTSIQNAHATGRVIGGHQRAFFRQSPVDMEHAPILIPQGYIHSSITDMTRWAGIHLGIVDVPEPFARVVARSQENFHTATNPFAEFDYHHVAGGWVVWDDSGIIEHTGAATGYVAAVRLLGEDDAAVVILANSGVFGLTINRLADITADAVIHGRFNNIGVDLYVIIDIVLTAAIIWGLFSLYKFVRLLTQTIKRVRGGEAIKYSGIQAKWFFDLTFAVAILLAIYLVLPNIFGLPVSILIVVMPINMLIAILFAWFDLAHSLFGLWVRVFLRAENRGK
ncbi:MAG: beta-lactamase family protein [Defluviitaleaceae bacterium]|nr:beta-lactamase family protein [Defluviitaleaceae bacterium]MCL2239864.1 beta-lactamase family protein [Defluviitaleaceae bacterium]